MSNVEEVLERIKGLKVLVCGDIMLDVYTYGNVERISPEAPVPIVEVIKREYKPGGASNVAVNTCRLGCSTTLLGIVGDDEDSKILDELCHKSGINTIFLPLRNKTTRKERIIGARQQMMRLDIEENHPLPEEQVTEIINTIKKIMSKEKFDVIIMEDYDKGFFSAAVVEYIVSLKRDHKVFISADPKKRNFGLYRGISLLKPNLKEFIAGAGLSYDASREEVFAAARSLRKNWNIEHLMITMGAEGIYYVNDREEGVAPARAMEVVDITGAGDTVVATASLCLASGLSLSETSFLCNISAGIVCGKLGTYAPTPHEIIQAMKSSI